MDIWTNGGTKRNGGTWGVKRDRLRVKERDGLVK